jgi:hypothetical protein
VLTVGDNGQIAAQFQRRLDLVLSDEEHRSARQQGILYNLRVPMNAPGGYQVRAAVRDERSRAIGTSSQFFDVPAVGQRRVALSGVVMGATAARGEEPAAEGGVTITQLSMGEGVFSEPGVRIFKPGSDALYTCEIYDGVSDAGTALTTFATLLRDGRAVFQTPETPVSRRTKGVLRTVPVAGRLSLGRTMPRGPYTLQVTVAEARNGRVRTRASQWVDFEVR